MVSDATLSTEFTLVEGSQVVIQDQTGNDFRDAALIIRDFLQQTDGRTELYSITPGKQAESIALQLELALERDEDTVMLSQGDFVCLSSLLENYDMHGFGRMRLQDSEEAPVSRERFDQMKSGYHAATEALFPIQQ